MTSSLPPPPFPPHCSFFYIYMMEIVRKTAKESRQKEALLCKYINVCVIEFMRFQTFTFMIFNATVVVVAYYACEYLWCSYTLAFNMVQCHFGAKISYKYNRHLGEKHIYFFRSLIAYRYQLRHSIKMTHDRNIFYSNNCEKSNDQAFSFPIYI